MTIIVLPCESKMKPRYDEEELLDLLDHCGISREEVEEMLNFAVR